jgi:hypothetical protein
MTSWTSIIRKLWHITSFSGGYFHKDKFSGLKFLVYKFADLAVAFEGEFVFLRDIPVSTRTTNMHMSLQSIV